MFGFLKKKDNLPAQGAGQRQPQGQSFQSTKVEDDMASFEIPDFTDDDLNFDLGIGEFMPQGGIPPVPQEKKQEPVPEEQPPMQESAKDEAEFEVQKTEEQKEAGDELPPAPTQEDVPKEINNLKDVDPDELPKFAIDSPEEIPAVPVEEKHKKTKVHKKEHTSHQAKKKDEIKHFAQASPEGFFVPKDVYRKIIILADDTTKKGIEGQEIRREFSVLSKTRKDIIASADKDAKDIKDSLLSMDSRLFGGK